LKLELEWFTSRFWISNSKSGDNENNGNDDRVGQKPKVLFISKKKKEHSAALHACVRQ
jgi:hypothetical protein